MHKILRSILLTILYNNVLKDFIITIHTITPVGKQYKDSAYVHESDLSLTVQTQRQMHSSQWRIRMKWSLRFCAAFFLAV
jgi:hypothetical protein